jgi:hypothetical protein
MVVFWVGKQRYPSPPRLFSWKGFWTGFWVGVSGGSWGSRVVVFDIEGFSGPSREVGSTGV